MLSARGMRFPESQRLMAWGFPVARRPSAVLDMPEAFRKRRMSALKEARSGMERKIERLRYGVNDIKKLTNENLEGIVRGGDGELVFADWWGAC